MKKHTVPTAGSLDSAREAGARGDRAARAALKRLEMRITMAVCDVEGIVTQAEMDEVQRLRRIVGQSFDAINGRWVALDEEAD